MATYYKIVDGVKMEMTAEESAEREAIDKAFEDEDLIKLMNELTKGEIVDDMPQGDVKTASKGMRIIKRKIKNA